MTGRLLLLVRGMVRVRVTGAALPRFLNACAQQGITLHGMKRTDWNELYATLSVTDFRALRHCMGRTGCRVHIVRRRGVPFAAARTRLRPVLWAGAAALCALYWILCAHIWAIEAHIDPLLPRAEVLRQLDELGVCIGARRSAIDVQQVRWQMLQMQPQLRFLALNIQGNKLVIEAQAAELPEEKLDLTEITRVVAVREGVIRTVRAQQGQPVVREGDAVQTGDELIAALVPPTAEGGKYHLTHARGEVEAYTVRRTAAIRPLNTEKKEYTGKVRRQYALILGNKRLNLYIGSGITGGTCDKIIETRELWLSDSVKFPVSLMVQTYTAYERIPYAQRADAVRVDMVARALGNMAADMDGCITTHTETVTEQGGAAVLHLTANAIEQIGAEAADDSVIPAEPQEENRNDTQP